MNQCRMTWRILLTFAVTVFLCGLPVLAKDAEENAPRSIQPLGQTDLQKAVVDQDHGAVEYQNEALKVAPRRPDGQPLKSVPAATYLAEDFEVAVPPAGWTEIILNASFNWKQQTVTSYSGSACADVEYDPALNPQDEWLVTPSLNFSGATPADLKIEFYWMMSYYWGVSPYDNYDLELWISTDGGATWPTKLWDESAQGTFSNWVWYKASIGLSAYAGQSDVKFAWRYVGVDGAQAAVDLVTVNDNPAPVGRCCYIDGTCDDITQAECTSSGGVDWNQALNCASNPCPGASQGDNCSNPLLVTLPAELPWEDKDQTTCGRGNFYANTCLDLYDGGEDIVYEITVTATVTVDISLNPKGTTYTGFAIDDSACPLDAGATDCIAKSTSSAGGVHKIMGLTLNPGTYYLMVDTWPAPNCIPDFDLKIEESAGPTPGDNCSSPYPITLSGAMLPYTESGLYNCGRGNTYDNTCLGSYDGGEDIIIQLTLTEPLLLDITLNPKGTTWSGMAIDNVCPLDAGLTDCIGKVTSSSGTPKKILGLNLAAGTYYIMVDTWPTPNCIPDFDLTFEGGTPPPPNDMCANATPVGDVVNLPFSTTAASFDGPGGFITSPNIWYCYTASCDGNVTVSLCGSTYDTKVRVWDGCACPPTVMLQQNDDFCGLQSQATFSATMGNTYLIEVGGYSAATGDGVMTISCVAAPPNDNCEDVTPVVLTPGVPVTFYGDNTGASNQCPSFPGGHVWEAFTINECADVKLDYCGTSPAFGNAWLNLAIGCPCVSFTSAGVFNTTECGDGNVTIRWAALPAGTYYYPVLLDPAYGAEGPYQINVVADPVVQYCAAGSNICDEYVQRVEFGSIDNSSSCGSGGYQNWTAISTYLLKTIPYPLTVTTGNPYSGDQCGVWIDWNQDMCFDETERIIMSGGPASFTANVVVPPGAPEGPTRMRVRITYTGVVAPCGNTSYGEVEDYTVIIRDLEPTVEIEPHPQYLYFMFALTPITNTYRVGMFSGGYDANDVNLSSVKINGLTPTSATVLPSAPGFLGPVLN